MGNFKIVFLILVLFLLLNNTSEAEDYDFEFTAIYSQNIEIGKIKDEVKEMNSSMVITFKDNKLKMVYESGKVFAEFNVLRVIKTKETLENNEVINRTLVLEYLDKDLYNYITLEYNQMYGEKYYSLWTSYNIDGRIYSYYIYSN